MSSGDAECLTTLTGGQMVGLAFVAEAAIISLVAVSLVLLFIGSNVIRNLIRPPPRGWKFIQHPLDLYVLSLLFSELWHSIGGAMSAHWVTLQSVRCSGFCSAQGIILNISSASTAIISTAIAVHTFVSLAFNKRLRSLRVAWAVVIATWTYSVLFTLGEFGAIQKSSHPFITPVPYWCWISDHYVAARLMGEYIWLWIAALSSIILYLLVVFILRGLIDTDPREWWRFRIIRNLRSDNEQGRTEYLLLLYPLVTLILVVPTSVSRWISVARGPHAVPSSAQFAVYTLYSLTGLANVLVLKSVRPDMLLIGRVQKEPENRLSMASTQMNEYEL